MEKPALVRPRPLASGRSHLLRSNLVLASLLLQLRAMLNQVLDGVHLCLVERVAEML